MLIFVTPEDDLEVTKAVGVVCALVEVIDVVEVLGTVIVVLTVVVGTAPIQEHPVEARLR